MWVGSEVVVEGRVDGPEDLAYDKRRRLIYTVAKMDGSNELLWLTRWLKIGFTVVEDHLDLLWRKPVNS
ncbi:hypothetical protein MtrunA17_Chr8g0370811 [Medicago truncatula]|uniref:Uncharacterized protein n=1 Tax=Medicago truncatula TaxID=3880 RepID=A0A396GTE6_MEDTR|nr:hypothetical protein MtrunA17_Chr8g0370811 [Medicago truncatula]